MAVTSLWPHTELNDCNDYSHTLAQLDYALDKKIFLTT